MNDKQFDHTDDSNSDFSYLHQRSEEERKQMEFDEMRQGAPEVNTDILPKNACVLLDMRNGERIRGDIISKEGNSMILMINQSVIKCIHKVDIYEWEIIGPRSVSLLIKKVFKRKI